MARLDLLLLSGLAAALLAPSSALAASTTPSPSNICLTTNLDVTQSSGTEPGENTVTATFAALGSVGLRISRLHLDFEVQERTATAWVRFVTDQHAETYTNHPGSKLDRVWTLREDSQPIDALLENHVQMRVYAKLFGACRGGSLGSPLLFGLSPPSMLVTSAT